MNAVCLLIDRLHAGYLGCYGNTWIATPNFDRLAAESFVLDQALADSTSLAERYRALGYGRHALESDSGPSLVRRLHDAGIASTLLTDAGDEDLPLAGAGDPLTRIDLERSELRSVANEIEDTRWAEFFAAAIEWLDSAAEPFCLWLDGRSLGTLWDAPLDFRRRYADPDEPVPPDTADVPRLALPPDYDPDQLLGITQSYAGQVTLLDECLGAFLEYFRQSRHARSTLLVCMSTRGLALGEHRLVGAWDDTLWGETVRLACMLRFPDDTGRAARTPALVQPPDVTATLADFWQLASQPGPPGFARSLLPLARDQQDLLRERVVVKGPAGQRAIRTRAWCLQRPKTSTLTGEAAVRPRLFAQPDDRFEQNDVALRCPEVVEQLERALEESERLIAAGELEGLSPLDEGLTVDMR